MRRCRRSPEHGAVVVELALTAPIIIVIILAGFQLGRVMLTRHRLADATTYATRSAAIAGDTTPTTITTTIRNRMGSEMQRCASLDILPQVKPGAYPGAESLEVQAVCHVSPLFRAPGLAELAPVTLTVVAAMPL
jgi:hypothetical protein